jgi:hypothetical protein
VIANRGQLQGRKLRQFILCAIASGCCLLPAALPCVWRAVAASTPSARNCFRRSLRNASTTLHASTDTPHRSGSQHHRRPLRARPWLCRLPDTRPVCARRVVHSTAPWPRHAASLRRQSFRDGGNLRMAWLAGGNGRYGGLTLAVDWVWPCTALFPWKPSRLTRTWE